MKWNQILSVFYITFSEKYGCLPYPKTIINACNSCNNYREETKNFESENTMNLVNELLSVDMNKSS